MISILVPVYNVALYIERCARSLFNQSFEDCEFIFVNDCTPDDSIIILNRVIKEYPTLCNRIRIIDHPKNMGLAAARNTAISHAHGDYIMHVDSDDFLDKEALKKMYMVAVADDSDIVICDFMELNKKSQRILHNNFPDNKIDYIHSLLTRKSLVNIIGRLIKKSLILDNNLWEVEGLNQGEDYLMTPRLAYYSNIISKVSEPLYIYNRSNVYSYTNNIKDRDILSIISVQKKLIDFFTTIKDAEVYRDIINESSIYNKISLLYCAPISSYPVICNEYKAINWKQFNLKTKHRIILELCDHQMYTLTYWALMLAKRLGQ